MAPEGSSNISDKQGRLRRSQTISPIQIRLQTEGSTGAKYSLAAERPPVSSKKTIHLNNGPGGAS
jgi:hypothetical protein